MVEYYVYIVANTTNSVLYIGVTNNLAKRMYEHQNDLSDGFTTKYRCRKLVYYEVTHSITDAIQREKQLKGWRRKWKEELIVSANPTWDDVGKHLYS